MPVIDHEVHESVRVGPDHRYGCWNSPRPKSEAEGGGYYAPSRQYAPSGNFTMVKVFIPHRLSTDCRYDGKGGLTKDDPACEGCQHYKVSDYVKQISEKGI